MKHRTKIIIYSSYLALGGIAIYVAIGNIGGYALLSQLYNLDVEKNIEYLITITTTLVAGILLIITYHGFLHARTYPKLTGLSGCAILLIYPIYWYVDSINSVGSDYEFIYYNFSILSIMIASIILLILTLVYWKKLSE